MAQSTGQGRNDVIGAALVTPAVIQAKIAELELAANLSEGTRTQLTELYRQSLGNLEEIRVNTARATQFAADIHSTARQAEAIRQSLAAPEDDPLADLAMDVNTPLSDIEQRLGTELINQAATRARQADFERRLTYHHQRPTLISQRLSELQAQQEAVVEMLLDPPATDQSPILTQAQRWALETRGVALSTEIRMLEQELLGQPMRVALLEANRDREIATLEAITARVRFLNELVNRKRQLEAEEIRREAADLDPLLVDMAEDNADLAEELNTMATRLDDLERARLQAEALTTRIRADYHDAQTILEASGLVQGLGQVLLEHRETLPDLKVHARRQRSRQEQIAGAMVRRLRHREEIRRIADAEASVARLDAGIDTDLTAPLRERLGKLVARRQDLLARTLEADEHYLAALRELDAAGARMLEAAVAYDDFLDQHLFWLRSAKATGLADLYRLPGELRELLVSRIPSSLGAIFSPELAYSPWIWLSLLVAGLLLWKRWRLSAAIQDKARRLAKPSTDSFADTFRALCLSLLVVVPVALTLAVLGWELLSSRHGTELSHETGLALLRLAGYGYILAFLRILCMPNGLAMAHFRWSESSVRVLHSEIRRLGWVFLPGMLLLRLLVELNPGATGGTPARLVFLLIYGVFSVSLYRIFHPARGVLARKRARGERSLLMRTYWLWFPLLLGLPSVLIVLALSGYIYSVLVLIGAFMRSLVLLVLLVIAHALALRWVMLVRRRLRYQAALERLAARQSENNTESAGGDEESSLWQIEEPEVDLAALSDETRQLLGMIVILTGAVVLNLIWLPVLPALGILDNVTLWHYSVVTDGENQYLPVTLADLGLALIYLVIIVFLVRRLPALLEIMLLRHLGMSSGDRYAAISLINYAIIAVGMFLVLYTLGTQWAQLQWLVAALGVGIGFGLQEIVANFVSGLIIMFERPVRIGDIITVGDTDGVVTRIRIRATTIRNWDYKELLIPNKEFITGRLLNWSLSDPTTRLVIPVRVAADTDVDRALAIMREAAEAHPHVVEDPAPLLTFESFEDDILTLVLRAYVDAIDYRLSTLTELHKTIHRRLGEAGIVIAVSRRELHLRAAEPLRVRLDDGDGRTQALTG